MHLRQLKFFVFHPFSIFFLKHCATLGSRVSNFSILTTDKRLYSRLSFAAYGCFGSSEIAGPSGSSLYSTSALSLLSLLSFHRHLHQQLAFDIFCNRATLQQHVDYFDLVSIHSDISICIFYYAYIYIYIYLCNSPFLSIYGIPNQSLKRYLSIPQLAPGERWKCRNFLGREGWTLNNQL